VTGGATFLGFSATIASVVIKRPAIDAASCSAVRYASRPCWSTYSARSASDYHFPCSA
jgi:hypothetical protein